MTNNFKTSKDYSSLAMYSTDNTFGFGYRKNNPDKSEQLEITRVVVAHTNPMCFKSKDAKAD